MRNFATAPSIVLYTTQAWCPATHFGYQTQGTCKIKFEDGTETDVGVANDALLQ